MNQFSRFILSMAKVGCIGFGGGSALIPVIEEEVIEKQELDTKDNYNKDVIVASITPGALPVELAGSLGRRNFGLKGMIAGAVAMAIPGTFATILMITALAAAKETFIGIIEEATIGVSAFILVLLTNYIYGVLKTCKKESEEHFIHVILVILFVFLISGGKNFYRLIEVEQVPIFAVSAFHILLAAFFLLFTLENERKLSVKAVLSVLLCTVYLFSYGKQHLIDNLLIQKTTEILMILLSVQGISKSVKECREKGNMRLTEGIKDAGYWLGMLLLFALPALILHRDAWLFLGKGILSALMSFGGGDAYLTIADGLFVEDGMVSSSQYYGMLVSVVNVLPGSILCKTLAGIGYYVGINLGIGQIGSILFALAGFGCSIAASCGCFSIIYQVYDGFSSLSVIQLVSRWIRPIISGLLLNVMLSLGCQCAETAEAIGFRKIIIFLLMVLLYLADTFLLKKTKLKPAIVLVLNLVVVFCVFL